MSVPKSKKRRDSGDDTHAEPTNDAIMLSDYIMVPSEWRRKLPAHVRKLAVTPLMAATFADEARPARAITPGATK